MCIRDRLELINVETKALVMKLETPKSFSPNPPVRNSNLSWKPVVVPKVVSPTISRTSRLSFSPNGKSIAATFSLGNYNRLVCWNEQGKITSDTNLALRRFGQSNILHWFPDGKRLLAGNDVIDIEFGIDVVSLRQHFGSKPVALVSGNDHLVGSFASRRYLHLQSLESVEIPRASIRQSLKVLKSGGDALLSPSKPIGLRIDLENFSDEHRSDFETEFKKMLGLRGFQLDEKSASYFNVREIGPEESLSIYRKQVPPDARDRVKELKLEKERGAFVLEYITEGKAVWRQMLSSFVYKSKNRENLLKSLKFMIGKISVPYFIPRTDELSILPLVIPPLSQPD